MPASVQHHIPSFLQLLAGLEQNLPALPAYPATYLQQLLAQKQYFVRIYAFVLDKLLEQSGKIPHDITLVDYGAGNGLLGLFAHHCGFTRVVLADTSSTFLAAAKTIATQLQIPVDYVEGDIDALLEWCIQNDLPDAVVGTDVIEHIYDLEHFLQKLAEINTAMHTVFTTASVSSNTYKSKQLQQLQKMDEHTGSNLLHAQPGDHFAGMPFRQIRYTLLQQHMPSLTIEQLAALADATRGLNKADMLQAADQFVLNGTLPVPQHATNTCDPITGSWTERLLSVEEYEALYRKAGFKLNMYNGFYNQWQHGAKSLSLRMLNTVIKASPLAGKKITPFITLVGHR